MAAAASKQSVAVHGIVRGSRGWTARRVARNAVDEDAQRSVAAWCALLGAVRALTPDLNATLLVTLKSTQTPPGTTTHLSLLVTDFR